MLTIHVLPRRLKEFLLTHPLYKSPTPLSSHGMRLAFTIAISFSSIFNFATHCRRQT